MDSLTIKNKPLSFSSLYFRIKEIVKTNWLSSLIIIAFIFIILAIIIIILTLLGFVLIKFNLVSQFAFSTSTIIWQAIIAVIFYLAAIFAQFLFINNLLNPGIKLKENLSSFKINFWNFLCLNIIINILFLLATMPIYIAAFLLSLNNLILGIICLLFGYVLILFLASYLFFSPFILIEKKTSCPESIKLSLNLVEGKFWSITSRILILSILLLLLNKLSLIVYNLPLIGSLLSLIILIILILLGFVCTFALYQDLKSSRNT